MWHSRARVSHAFSNIGRYGKTIIELVIKSLQTQQLSITPEVYEVQQRYMLYCQFARHKQILAKLFLLSIYSKKQMYYFRIGGHFLFVRVASEKVIWFNDCLLLYNTSSLSIYRTSRTEYQFDLLYSIIPARLFNKADPSMCFFQISLSKDNITRPLTCLKNTSCFRGKV